MKNDEKNLFLMLQEKEREEYRPVYVRELVLELKMNQKRAAYILEKWTNKGLYEYGVSVFAGWLTEEGKNTSLN